MALCVLGQRARVARWWACQFTIAGNGVRTIIVETANRFARDLMVQEVGFGLRCSSGRLGDPFRHE